MKISVKKAIQSNSVFNSFSGFTVTKKQMEKVKGGEDIITEEVIQQ